MAAVSAIKLDKSLTAEILKGYLEDPFCRKLFRLLDSLPGLQERNGLLYLANRLVIPRVHALREKFFHLAHDALGHFGMDKTYAALRHSFYWPHMRRDLASAYIPACVHCMRNKSPTTAPAGPLHPLPVPDSRGDSVAIDFVGPLPEDQGFNMLVTMTDRLGADLRLVPCRSSITAPQFASLFFDHWYCENGLPLEIISDRDKLFLSRFWKHLHQLTGVKLKMSSSYHPQTDGSSERTNKTVNQCIRFHIERNQKGWVKALPRVRFHIMNSINGSTGFTPFQLHLGRSPRLLPPLSLEDTPPPEGAESFLSRLQLDILEAQDNLLAAKASQAHAANQHRVPDPQFQVGDQVMLSTKHRRHEYITNGTNRVAKFMPRYDGPYHVVAASPTTSTYTLDIPRAANTCKTFHASQLRAFVPNDRELFPARELPRPGPVVTAKGQLENFVERILDEKRVGRTKKYLVRWLGYGAEDDEWLPRKELEECEALDDWEREHPP